MPSHKLHCYVDRQLFNKSYWKIHKKMDEPYLLLGREHRVLFHDPVTACAIAKQCYPSDPNAVWAAYIHIHLDEICSADPLFKENLEFIAELDVKERVKARRKKKATKVRKKLSRRSKPRRNQFPDPMKEFMKFIKKVKQIQDFCREFMK